MTPRKTVICSCGKTFKTPDALWKHYLDEMNASNLEKPGEWEQHKRIRKAEQRVLRAARMWHLAGSAPFPRPDAIHEAVQSLHDEVRALLALQKKATGKGRKP